MFHRVIFLMLVYGNCIGQITLKGKYCSPRDYVGKCITFNGDSLFDYYQWTCLSKDEGKGTYYLNKKNITLKFKSNDTFENKFEVRGFDCKSKDSVVVTIQVKDRKRNEPIAFAHVVLRNKTKTIKNIQTNIDGIAEIKFKKVKGIFDFQISDFGHRKFITKIKLDQCQEIHVVLAESKSGVIENGTIKKYKLKKNDLKEYLLIDKYNNLLSPRDS